MSKLEKNIHTVAIPSDDVPCFQWYDKMYPFERRVSLTADTYQWLREQPKAQQAIANGDYVQYVLAFLVSYRVRAFAEVEQHFDDLTYWTLLGHIFRQARNLEVHRDLWLRLMRSPRPCHLQFMTDEQRECWNTLPDKVYIFRGYGAKNKYGIRYTLRLRYAMSVAQNHGKDGQIASYRVSKHDLFYHGGDLEFVYFVQGLGAIHDRT